MGRRRRLHRLVSSVSHATIVIARSLDQCVTIFREGEHHTLRELEAREYFEHGFLISSTQEYEESRRNVAQAEVVKLDEASGSDCRLRVPPDLGVG